MKPDEKAQMKSAKKPEFLGMRSVKGTGVFKDIVIGKLVFYERQLFKVDKKHVPDVQRELIRFQNAKELAVRQVRMLHQIALREVSEENAAIFQAHHMMLEDMDFNGYVVEVIKNQQANAEYAVKLASDTFYEMFSGIQDPYLKQRAADVRDISQRLLTILTCGEIASFEPDQPAILAADELVPSEVMQLPREKVLAFVTKFGSENSHAAIIAKDRTIPSLLGLGDQLCREFQGHMAAVDSYTGTLYIDPDEKTLERLREKKNREEEKMRGLSYLIGKPNRTIDGKEIGILANITEPLDVEQVLRSDADGLGLMRSEFLYLKRDDLPSEQEQVNAYREVIRRMDGKPTIIRTLDFGAKKMIELSKRQPEVNPVLGFRSIRICLAMPQMFQTQLRAIFRASHYGPVSILFPMVDSVEQLQQVLEHVKKARTSLAQENIAFAPDVKLGLVIETPASVILSQELAQYVDFFSIDTNDLIQYTLAVDRQNPKVNHYYNIKHPAVLRMIEMTVQSAHEAGIKVNISGDMADNADMIEWFIRTGVDGISVSAASILPLRQKVRELDLSADEE